MQTATKIVENTCLVIISRVFQFAIRIDSIRYANRFDSLRESIRIDLLSKKNRPFDSLVVVQFFLVYLLYSLSQKNKLTSLFAAFNTLDVFN